MSVATLYPRPVAVRAVQWDGTNEAILQLGAWVNAHAAGDEPTLTYTHDPDTGFEVTLATLHGLIELEEGDWVVDRGGNLGFGVIGADELDRFYTDQAPVGALTDDEHALGDLLGQAYNLFAIRVCGPGPSARGDVAEFAHHIHVLQNAVMCQAAARAYPDRYRLAGGVIAKPADPVAPQDLADTVRRLVVDGGSMVSP